MRSLSSPVHTSHVAALENVRVRGHQFHHLQLTGSNGWKYFSLSLEDNLVVHPACCSQHPPAQGTTCVCSLHPADVQGVTGYTQGVGLAAAGSARGPRPCLLSWSLLSCLHWAEPGWAQSVCSGSSGYNTTQLDSENTEEGLLCRACCHYRPPPVSGSCYLTTLDTRSRPRSLSSGPRRQRPS